MPLDYNGIPEFSRKRELRLQNVPRAQLDAFLETSQDDESPEDEMFDNVARTFIKGEVLKDGIANMNPAGFVPVEEEASVIASIQRVNPGAESYLRITFGMFKEACEHIASRANSIDEDFLVNFNIIDPNLQASTVTTKYKEVNKDGSDWISAFLERLSPVAGLLIAGKLVDMYMAGAPQLGVDSLGGSGEMKTWSLQGLPAAIAILIELGLTLKSFNDIYGDSPSIPPEARQQFDELYNNPGRREKILRDAGYNYDALKSNQKFNDYKAIKDYAVSYITRNDGNLNFDHWLTFAQVVDSQTVVKSVAAMAPTFSGKWRKFYDTNPEAGTQEETEILVSEQTANDLEGIVGASLNASIAGYVNNTVDLMSKQYEKTYLSLYYTVDPAVICCLVWFLGPMDTSSLREISRILKIATMPANVRFSFASVIDTNYLLTTLLGMIGYYISWIMDNTLRRLYEKMLGVPPGLLVETERACLGLGVLFDLIEKAFNVALEYLEGIIKNLQMETSKIGQRLDDTTTIIAERRGTGTITALLDVVVDKIDAVQAFCTEEPEDPQITAEALADKTLDFVSTGLPKLFPVIEISESDRRKHFRNIPSFTIEGTGLEVPGTDESGEIVELESTGTDGCSSASNTSKGIALGQKLAAAIRGN